MGRLSTHYIHGSNSLYSSCHLIETQPASRKMRTSSILLLPTLLVGLSRADVTCDECMSFVGNLQNNLMTTDHVTEQTNLMYYLLCNMVEYDDYYVCIDFIKEWWPKIAAAMYPKFVEPNLVCNELGACTSQRRLPFETKDATCEECKAGVNSIASFLTGKSKEITEFLVGGMCESSGDKAEECKQNVPILIPSALPLIANRLFLESETYCCYEGDYLCC